MCPEGSWLTITTQVDGLAVSITAVYAPVDATSRLPWLETFAALPPPVGEWVVCGDWNMVTNPKLDSAKPYPDLLKGGSRLQAVLQKWNLVDAMRETFPKYRWYTRFGEASANRLDRFYVTPGLMPGINPERPQPVPWSDHQTVTIRMGPARPAPKRPHPITTQKVLQSKQFQEEWHKFWPSQRDSCVQMSDSEYMIWFDDMIGQFQKVYRRAAKRANWALHTKRSLARDALDRLDRRMQAATPTIKQLTRRHRMAALLNDLDDWGLDAEGTKRQVTWLSIANKPHLVYKRLKARASYRPRCPSSSPIAPNDHKSFGDRAVSFYSDLMRSEGTDKVAQDTILQHARKLRPEEVELLDRSITLDELSEALGAMNEGAPGPDGLTVAFWRKVWPDVGRFLQILVWMIEKNGVASPHFLQGLIRLIFKSGDDDDPSCYRPITLLQVHYKIVTKVLATRWSEIAMYIFIHSQIGFVPTRFIGTNVRLVLDTREDWKSRNAQGAWLFLDFKKAYDRIEWPWLKACLQAMGCGPRFMMWINALYRPVSSAQHAN